MLINRQAKYVGTWATTGNLAYMYKSVRVQCIVCISSMECILTTDGSLLKLKLDRNVFAHL